MDMSVEVSSLQQPLSGIEASFIMGRCPIIDREYWMKMLKEARTSHAATDIMSDLQPTMMTASSMETELEICHFCG